MDANFRWFEGEKAQFRFVPYDWAFLFKFGPALIAPTYDWAFLFSSILKISFYPPYKGEGNVGQGSDLFDGEAFF